jgi:hypothetical protein
MPDPSLEDRLRAVEDHLAILNLIASHPPSADTGSNEFAATMWAEDGVFDQGGTLRKGREIANFSSPQFQKAMQQGIAHFSGLPYIRVTGDTAVAVSYLQVLAPDHAAAPDPLSAHPPPEGAQGYRVHRLSANRWEFVRTAEGWKIARRTLRLIEGKDASRVVLRTVTEDAGAGS